MTGNISFIMYPLITKQGDLPMLRSILVTAAVVLSFILPSFAAAEGCIKDAAVRSGNGIDLTVANRCGSTQNVNVCMHIVGRQPDPNSRNAAQVRNGKSYTFSFVDFDNSRYEYSVQWCGGGRVDGCPAPCPNSAGTRTTTDLNSIPKPAHWSAKQRSYDTNKLSCEDIDYWIEDAAAWRVGDRKTAQKAREGMYGNESQQNLDKALRQIEEGTNAITYFEKLKAIKGC